MPRKWREGRAEAHDKKVERKGEIGRETQSSLYFKVAKMAFLLRAKEGD
jgi:hypothetical protein